MNDYTVGYGKPPLHSRFKNGNTEHLKRRSRQVPPALGDIVDHVLNGSTEYREEGRTKTAARHELTIKTYVKRALEGDVKAAETLLRLRAHGLRFDGRIEYEIELEGWLPDHDGQTGEQKTNGFAAHGLARAPEWWKKTVADPSNDDSES